MGNINWLFIAVIIVVIISGYLGWKKGVIRMVYSLLAVVLAIILTILLSPITKSIFMKNETIYNGVNNKVMQFVDFTGIYEKFADRDEVMKDTENDGQTAIGAAGDLLSGLGLPEGMIDSVLGDESLVADLEKSADSDIGTKIQTLEKNVYSGITQTIIKAIAFVVTLIVVGLILFILGFVFDWIGQIPLIENINEIVGALVGGAIGIVVVWVFFAIVTAVSTTQFGQTILGLINDNPILSFIYENNIISKKIFKN